MIDPERVCEMTKLAAYEEHEGKKYRQAMQFFRRDFVGRHLLKGFFCATIVFGLILLAWGVCNMDDLVENMASMDLIQFGTDVLIRYFLFLIVYLVAVDIYANIFYAAGRRNQKRYLRRLKRLGRLYREKEEMAVPGHYESIEITRE